MEKRTSSGIAHGRLPWKEVTAAWTAVFPPPAAFMNRRGRGIFPLRWPGPPGAQAFIYHWHDAAEVLLGLSGETTAAVADRPYRLAEGDVLLIPPGESHCLFPSGAGDTRLVLMFEPVFFLGGEPYADVRQKLPLIPPPQRAVGR